MRGFWWQPHGRQAASFLRFIDRCSNESVGLVRKHKIKHVTKEVMADNQLSLVDSKMGQLKKEMFMQMVSDADDEARIYGVSSWSE